jgi:hypothetical protein
MFHHKQIINIQQCVTLWILGTKMKERERERERERDRERERERERDDGG